MINLIAINSGSDDKREMFINDLNGYKVNYRSYVIGDVIQTIASDEKLLGMAKGCYVISDFLKNYKKLILCENESIEDVNFKAIKDSFDYERVMEEHEDYTMNDVRRHIRRALRPIDKIINSKGFKYSQLKRTYCFNGIFKVPEDIRGNIEKMNKWCIKNWGGLEPNEIKVARSPSLDYLFIPSNSDYEKISKHISEKYEVDVTHYHLNSRCLGKKKYISGQCVSNEESENIGSFISFYKSIFSE